MPALSRDTSGNRTETMTVERRTKKGSLLAP